MVDTHVIKLQNFIWPILVFLVGRPQHRLHKQLHLVGPTAKSGRVTAVTVMCKFKIFVNK